MSDAPGMPHEDAPKESPQVSGKRRRAAARLASVQALYQMDVAGKGVNEVLAEFETHWIGQEVEGVEYEPADPEFFRPVISGVPPPLLEGFGLPAAEAMSCGAPLVVTDGGALPEVFGDAGVVVPKGDSAALARAIAALLDDPVRRADLGAAARKRARSAFSWDRAAASYEAVLRQAVARGC